MITGGLNHAAHSGLFGDDFAASLITGKVRHMFGPDARAWSATISAGSAVTAGVEGGRLEILRGSDKGWHPLADASGGLGHVGFGVGGEFTKLYYSGSRSNITVDVFYGKRFEAVLSASLGAGPSLSANAVYSRNVDKNGGFVIGWGGGIGVGVYNLGAEINWGASGRNLNQVKDIINGL